MSQPKTGLSSEGEVILKQSRYECTINRIITKYVNFLSSYFALAVCSVLGTQMLLCKFLSSKEMWHLVSSWLIPILQSKIIVLTQECYHSKTLHILAVKRLPPTFLCNMSISKQKHHFLIFHSKFLIKSFQIFPEVILRISPA